MIAIITANTDTFSNPTLYALIRLMNRSGTEVGLFSYKNDNDIPPELNLTTRYTAPPGPIIPRKPWLLATWLRHFLQMAGTIRKRKVKDVIAVDQAGLILAGRLKRFIPGIRIHYFSFELFFRAEIREVPGLMKLKDKELKYIRCISSLVIQDRVRLNLFIEENKTGKNFRTFLVPVAPLSPLSSSKQYRKQDFGYDETDTIYIHSGSVANWAGIDIILAAIEMGLPANTYVLIHNRRKFDLTIPQQARLHELVQAGVNVKLHDEVFDSYEEYSAFLGCFDYGLALYQDDGGAYTGLNIKHIGLASGKFSTYLALGMPVLVTECPVYTDLLKENPFGEMIRSAEQLNACICKGSLRHISKADCLDFYQKVLNPANKLKEFIAQLNG